MTFGWLLPGRLLLEWVPVPGGVGAAEDWFWLEAWSLLEDWSSAEGWLLLEG